jgi:hypothetical protein
MSSPAPDDRRFRLAIDATLSPDGGDKKSPERYEFPQPSSGMHWAVLPADSGLGTLCAQVTYPGPERMVWAAAYPELFYPESPPPTHPMPSWARPGSPSADRTVWRWDASYPVRGAAHSAAGGNNMLAFWYQSEDSPDIVFDGALPFVGVTNLVPCASSGSGSGSGSGGTMLAGRLDSGDVLVVVPDGPLAGHHLARRVGALAWRVTVGGVVYTINSADGQTLTVRGGSKSAVSKTTAVNPFSATFAGDIFASRNDIVVVGA